MIFDKETRTHPAGKISKVLTVDLQFTEQYILGRDLHNYFTPASPGILSWIFYKLLRYFVEFSGVLEVKSKSLNNSGKYFDHKLFKPNPASS